MAFNRAGSNVLYPASSNTATYTYDGKVNDISVKNFFVEGSQPTIFETPIRTASDEDDKFQIILDQKMKFEEKTGQNLLVKVTSDFLRADVNFMVINADSKHIYRP